MRRADCTGTIFPGLQMTLGVLHRFKGKLPEEVTVQIGGEGLLNWHPAPESDAAGNLIWVSRTVGGSTRGIQVGDRIAFATVYFAGLGVYAPTNEPLLSLEVAPDGLEVLAFQGLEDFECSPEFWLPLEIQGRTIAEVQARLAACPSVPSTKWVAREKSDFRANPNRWALPACLHMGDDTPPGECVDGVQCGPDYRCIDYHCVLDDTPPADPTPRCLTDQNCPRGQVCVEGLCQ